MDKAIIKEKAFYLPGLNGIRAIAAFIVLLFHIDRFSDFLGVPELGYHKTGMASFGVVLFFVLSGFLITLLLLKEKGQFETISYKKFYIRRILRIWPLYYLIILIAILLFVFLAFPSDRMDWWAMGSYIFLLSNIGYILGHNFITITPLWSVGVEEQFYLFWPILLNRFKNVLNIIIFFLFAFVFFKVFSRIFLGPKSLLFSFLSATSFSCMAIGGIGACLIHLKSKILKWAFSPLFEILSWLFLAISVFYKPIHVFSIFDQELHSFFYLILILNVSHNEKRIISLDNKILDFIGKISYGIYAWHSTIIVLFSYYIKRYIEMTDSLVIKIILSYAAVIGLTILISTISYKFFEYPFLEMKKRFMNISSANTPS